MGLETRQERYLIEAGGQSVGLLISEDSGYTFFAAAKAARSLDRRHFPSLASAQRAVDDVVLPKMADARDGAETGARHDLSDHLEPVPPG